MINAALNAEFHLTAHEKIDLIEIVVMDRHVSLARAFIMENFESLAAHVLPWIKMLCSLLHGVHLAIIIQQELQCVKQYTQLSLIKRCVILKLHYAGRDGENFEQFYR